MRWGVSEQVRLDETAGDWSRERRDNTRLDENEADGGRLAGL
jgi:hypothetical protein